MSGPLAGLRVIEECGPLGQYAGKLLADMGADVIKVEPPEGSSARRIGPFVKDTPGVNRSLNFWYYNTNKRSVVLDLESSEDDRESFEKLVRTADILIEDCTPGELPALGLGHDAFKDHPALIYCSITPFGQDGPWAKYASSDMVGLALGGPMMMNGYDPEDASGAPPIRGHGDQGYNTACHYAVHGILAALLYRDRTGLGQYVDCSMHEALSCTVEVGMPYWLYAREDVVRQTARHAAARRTERWLVHAADGRDLILFGIGRDNSSWRKLKAWFQSHGFGMNFDEERFDAPQSRQPGRGSKEASEVYAEVARFVASQPGEYVYRGGQERDQAWGTIRSPEETLEDAHFWDRGHFVHTTGEGIDAPAAMPGAPYWFSKTPWELRFPAPKLGEHTSQVLESL